MSRRSETALKTPKQTLFFDSGWFKSGYTVFKPDTLVNPVKFVVFQKLLYQAPSPQRKKEQPPPGKLRFFLKRSSEPLLNLQNNAQQKNQFSLIISTTLSPSSLPASSSLISETDTIGLW
ncbi:hypothetical protein PV327_008770 [Microctonus hyperodae]|uniref:Uncharacterized protein n=1 Tax=Microctonus hyperodae TaxID=165561 RepID=A0AA39KV77_MICHY|nr:hypothetical protein PV327_008770 [Microctonus hyperodae]